jgi:hypothetical protein
VCVCFSCVWTMCIEEMVNVIGDMTAPLQT